MPDAAAMEFYGNSFTTPLSLTVYNVNDNFQCKSYVILCVEGAKSSVLFGFYTHRLLSEAATEFILRKERRCYNRDVCKSRSQQMSKRYKGITVAPFWDI